MLPDTNSGLNRSTSKKNLKTSGFTLVELIVTLFVIAMIATLGLPQMKNLIQNNHLGNTANKFIMSLHYSRSEAVKRHEAVRICASDDGINCVGSWENGWIVRTLDSNEVIERVEPDNQQINYASGSDTFITFAPDGAQFEPTKVKSIQLSTKQADMPYRRINISMSGAITSCQEPCE